MSICIYLCFVFLAHLRQRLKWDFLIKICPLFVVVVVRKTFYIFIFSSRTSGPISTKLGTKHLWVKGIQVCLNEGPHPFPRGDNKEIAKIHWPTLKIFFLRTTGPISTILGTEHPWDGKLCLFKWRAMPFSKGR